MKRPADQIYEILTGEDEGRVCKDIPETACKEQPRNFLTHVASLALTKTGDGFADPKLVLSWMLGALGAPAAAVGMLVPVREALALLPQLVTAGTIRALQRRKWVWVLGSAIQGTSVLAMALVALSLEGAAAGWSTVALLAIFALGRSLCSVAYKDVLGKTVSKGHRGTATGTASSISSVAVLALGAAFSSGLLELSIGLVAALLSIAGAFWFLSAMLFSSLPEEPGATQGGGNAWNVAMEQASLLWDDPQLTRFIATRTLLMGTALAPPFMLAAAGSSQEQDADSLGPFLFASALSGTISTYLWGRFADRSSRRVLALSGLVAAIVFSGIVATSLVADDPVRQPYAMAAALFVLMIAYKGVRLGRSTHIVDMAPADKRAAYTALSNTIVGVLLVFGGIFGVVASLFGNIAVIGIFAVMSLSAAGLALTLNEVQE